MSSIYMSENKEELFKYTLNLFKELNKKLDVEFDDMVDVFVKYHKQMENKGKYKIIKKPKKKEVETLEFIIIDGKEYLVSADMSLYRNDEQQKFIGRYDADNDVIVLC
jgi:hypothetical protein